MARTLEQVDAALAKAYAAQEAALNGDYSLDTGQGRQSVTRDLNAINKTIDRLENEREELTSLGITSVVVCR